MKTFFCIIMLLVPLFAATQYIQYGRVMAYRPIGMPLPNVQLYAEGARLAISDEQGNFELHFESKKPGDPLNLTEVRKTGYEWANRAQLEHARLAPDQQLDVTIIMSRPGEVDEVKAAIYDIAGLVSKREFDKQVSILKNQVRDGLIDKQQSEIRMKELEARLQLSLQQNNELAAFAARYYSGGNDLGNRLITLLETGETEKAVQIIDTSGLFETANRLLLAKKTFKAGPAADSLAKRIIPHVQLLMLAAKIYTLQLQPAKAEWLYQKALELQLGDPEQVKEIINYYRATGRYREALQLLGGQRVLQPDVISRSRSLLFSGHIYYAMGYKDSALYMYTRYFQEVQLFAQADSGNKTYWQELASAEKNLGTWYQNSLQVKAAIQHYQAAVAITRNISRQAVNDESSSIAYVQSLSALGNAWLLCYRYDSAIDYFDKGRQTLESLYAPSIKNKDIVYALALAYYQLGDAYYQQENYANAKIYLEKALALLEKEWSIFPAYDFLAEQVSITSKQLANTLSFQKDDALADTYYNKSIRIIRQLSEKNPVNVLYKHEWGIVCGDAALHEYRNKIYDHGLIRAEQYDALSSELYRQYQQAPEYGFSYAQALFTRALLLKKLHRKKKSSGYFQAAVSVLEKVLKLQPANYQPLALLGECYWQLGALNTGFFRFKRPAYYFYLAGQQFYFLCGETGFDYFCKRLAVARFLGALPWPFRINEKKKNPVKK